MLQYLLNVLPVLVALIAYFVRLEVKLAVIKRDLCWIKKRLEQIQ